MDCCKQQTMSSKVLIFHSPNRQASGNALRPKGGRDVAKSIVTFVALAFAGAFLSVQAMGQAPADSHPGFKASFVGSALTCSSQDKQPERVTVPRLFAKRAKLKARLLNLLHESLYDDSKGIVNVAREKEIADLAKKLQGRQGRLKLHSSKRSRGIQADALCA